MKENLKQALSALIFPFPFENDNAFIVKMCAFIILQKKPENLSAS